MEYKQIGDVKAKVKSGDMVSLISLVDFLHTEAQKKYNSITSDHRYHQGVVNTLADLLETLPE